jgi:NADPH-dependent 2,4-dienoyl-CoA reductase/sulfur reductase-like enzyme
MKRSCDVVIVGAGFAGLAAAEVLAARDLDIRILDENAHIGGQLLRTAFKQAGRCGRFELDGIKRCGFRLIERVARRPVTVMNGFQVLGIFDGNRILLENPRGRVSELTARFLICASGAREKFLPFRGWTLPGVISTGSAQILIKSSAILPAEKTLIGGVGPLPFVLAREIICNGGRVAAVLDPASAAARIGLLRVLPRHWLTLMEGARLLAVLRLAGIPVYSGTRIIEARGRRRLAAVVTARYGQDGRRIPGTERTFTAPCLAVGYGFVPNIELLLQAGCAVDYRPERGGWVARVGEVLESSRKAIFAAGEVTGIAGARKSFIEGRICGWAVLDQLGRAGPDGRRHLEKLTRKRRHELRYGAVINALCRPPAGWLETVGDETVICRCEDVRMGDIRRHIAEGFTTPAALKKASRCGMGTCQGRICAPILHEILAAEAGVSAETFGPASTRAPVKTVRLGALADADLN